MRSEVGADQGFALLQSLAAQKVSLCSLCSLLLCQWSTISAERMCEGAGACLEVTPLAPLQKPGTTVGEWLELQERGVVDKAELSSQLGLDSTWSRTTLVHTADSRDLGGACDAQFARFG